MIILTELVLKDNSKNIIVHLVIKMHAHVYIIYIQNVGKYVN